MQNLTPTKVKNALNNAIEKISASLEKYVRNPGKDFTRKRKLPFATMLKMLVGMGGNTICKELYDWFGYSPDTASTAAFVQQRGKILPKATEDLFHLFTKECSYEKLYVGYRLLAVDGSDLRLPANANDTESYFKNDSDDAKGYNLIHLDALYDLISKTYIDASLQAKRTVNEHNAFVKMVDRADNSQKAIITADRGYESYNNMAHIIEKGWFFVFRAKESFGIITKTAVPKEKEFDIWTTITLTKRQTKLTRQLMKSDPGRYRWLPPHAVFDYLAPKDDKFYVLHFRVVRFLLPDGKYETIFTNLPEADFPSQRIKEIYRARWGIETSFRALKYTIGLANIHSKKPAFITQEVFSRITFYNFCSIISNIAEEKIDKNRRINFVSAVLLCRCFFRMAMCDDLLLHQISRQTFLIRSDRAFTRYQAHTYAVGFAYRVQ